MRLWTRSTNLGFVWKAWLTLNTKFPVSLRMLYASVRLVIPYTGLSSLSLCMGQREKEGNRTRSAFSVDATVTVSPLA